MNIKDLNDYCVFDTETTGLDPATDLILEYGCIRVRNNKIVETYHAYSKQNIRIAPFLTAIHGIDNAKLDRDGIDPKDACKGCVEFIGDEPVLGLNNVPFDHPFLETEANRYGIQRPPIQNWFDVGLWHKGITIGNIWNGQEPFFRYALRIKDIRVKGVKYNLNFLAKHYEVENLRGDEQGLHGAIVDVTTTKNIFDKMKAKYSENTAVVKA